jgi:hypothetical protein
MLRSTLCSTSRALYASSSRRALHVTPIAAKTVSETAQDVRLLICQWEYIDETTTGIQVNMKVGKGLASAIEKGEQVAAATKEAVGACLRYLHS